MSVENCLQFARWFGVPEGHAPEWCADEGAQQCAAFFHPEKPGDDRNFENLAACYGPTTTEGNHV